ncbi:MAG: GLUG motif-containing protein [Sedimentisphaerales bacterium]
MKQLVLAILIAAGLTSIVDAKYSGGTGTSGDPYRIATAGDLLALAADTNDYDKNFILTADINLAAYTFTAAVIAPDSNSSDVSFNGTEFTGIFDGAGRQIANMTIDCDGVDHIGLFGDTVVGSEIKNLRLKNFNINAGNNSICIGGLAGETAGHISNCFSEGNIIGDNNSSYIGGLVGVEVNEGNIIDSYSVGTITGGNDSNYIGGLVGGIYFNGYINRCFSTSDITGGNNGSYIGGLMGENYLGSIANCFSTGTLTSEANYFGVGGLVGRNFWGSVENCYSTDKVSAGITKADLGGLVGTDLGYIGIISNSYFLNTAGPNNSIGVPLTDTQMKQQASFTGWDFNNIWTINEDANYPKLAWQSNTSPTPVAARVINVTKCSITAGSKVNTDKISFSGMMDANAADFNDANNSSDANFVEVTIRDENSEDMDPCVFHFPVNNKTFKKGKFNCTVTNKPLKMSFAFDTKKRTFSFSARNVDLTGLSCPVIVDINISDYAGSAEVNEEIVNGKKPIPISFLMDVKNSLRVDKSKFTKKLGVITQLSVSGGFSVENLNDANMATHSFDVNVGSQTFTIPIGKFKANTKGDKFSCSKVTLSGGEIAYATFNFSKCTFTLTIKNTNFAPGAGTADFRVDFASFSGIDEVTLP